MLTPAFELASSLHTTDDRRSTGQEADQSEWRGIPRLDTNAEAERDGDAEHEPGEARRHGLFLEREG